MGRHANILLVDNDLGVRQALEEVLTLEDYHVQLAASGSEAIRHLQQHGENKLDAVLLDLRFGPNDGWDFVERLTRLKPELPVIVITVNLADRAIPASARQCIALMQKPLDLPRLFDVLRHVTTERNVVADRFPAGVGLSNCQVAQHLDNQFQS